MEGFVMMNILVQWRFFGSRGSSLVDYCIVNSELFQEFSSFSKYSF